jgi:hypothetical protein
VSDLQRLLERVNAVPRPRVLSSRIWASSGISIDISSASGESATVLLDRSAANVIKFCGETRDARVFVDYVSEISCIVQQHYDDLALCAALNAVPGKPEVFSGCEWARNESVEEIWLRGGGHIIFFSAFGDACCFNAVTPPEFAPYLAAVSTALKEFNENSTR